jgi:cobalt-zinc-cadmium efflux system membrane fusion protein
MKAEFSLLIIAETLFPLLALLAVGCGESKPDPKAEAPPPVQVEKQTDASNYFEVDHPEQFRLVAAAEYKAVSSLNVTGVVQPDVARAVPVVSLASGRVVEIKARLGDEVKKGQVLLRVRSNDVSSAYQFYLRAVNDERYARLQDERDKLLFEKGAISKSTLEAADDAEQDALVDLQTAREQLRLLGADKDNFTGTVDVVAPISGVIADQQATFAAGVQGFGLGGPNPFTITDLSYVWIVCDVYENDLDTVQIGDVAEIHLNAFPGKALKGRVDNILPILDPNLRTAKVRLEVANPGKIMRVGMFATATFYGKKAEMRASVPAAAILHLHDRDWVYVPVEGKRFRRVEVVSGRMLPGNMQEVVSGVVAGARVVQDALVFQNTVEQ